jgi:Alginate export
MRHEKLVSGIVIALLLTAITKLTLAEDSDSSAQTPPPPQHLLGTIAITGEIRGRAEGWNWFYRNDRTRYAYGETLLQVAFSQHRNNFDWKIELAQPTLLGLPDGASFPGTGVPLGLGGVYFSANNLDRNVASVYLKQGYVLLTGLGGNGGSLQLGRFDFTEGREGRADDASLAWLKRERIAQRLIGDSYWTAAGRSVDGIHFSEDLGTKNNVTFVAARPTKGVYQLEGMGEVDVNLLYASYTRELPTRKTASEVRVFGLGYFDSRNVLKVDNRPLPVREADTHSIRIGTFGMDYVLIFPIRSLGRWDFLVWTAGQSGNWGVLHHHAGAVTAEAGWQPPTKWLLKWLRPWLRAGALSTSADGNPNDAKHTTFFQVLPTDRQYARLPFYTMQNVEDYTGQLILRPSDKLWLRSELHKVKLHGRNDLWYQGSGVFQNTSFGYEGLPAKAQGGLGDFVDLSMDYRPTKSLGFSAYLGALSGKATMTNLLRGRKAGMAYFEFSYRF